MQKKCVSTQLCFDCECACMSVVCVISRCIFVLVACFVCLFK